LNYSVIGNLEIPQFCPLQVVTHGLGASVTINFNPVDLVVLDSQPEA
jgi:hypothetical protein